MPENLEEKEKCLEKLGQMQRFLPFLDFMIEKINKRNENSLECQLSKFQHLRSMIAEKNGKHGWDVIVKVEDVIQKLILKLDYKDSYNLKSKESECSGKKTGNEDNKNSLNVLTPKDTETKVAAAVSVPSSTTTTISVTSPSSSSQVTTVDSRPLDSSTNTIDLVVMKTSKASVDVSPNKNNEIEKGKELISNSSDPDQSKSNCEKSQKTNENDLDKDLDGFELTDCPSFLNTDTSNNSASSKFDKVKFHDDLLSSSREKLLKSLQKTLFPSKTDVPPRTLTEKKDSDSPNIGSFSKSQNQVTFGECNSKETSVEKKQITESSVSEKSKVSVSDTVQENSKSVHPIPSRLFYLDNSSSVKKYHTDSSEYSSKQKLREKLSADICEVYRVSGKSVGGSLRLLKDGKKSLNPEEDELFKPDKIVEVHHPDRFHSNENKNKQNENSCRSSQNSKNENNKEKSENKKSFHSNSSYNFEKVKNKKGDKFSETNETKGNRNDSCKNNKSNQELEISKIKISNENSKKDCSKTCEFDSMNDEELMNFVSENVESLPHLSKLKPIELRKAINSPVSPEARLPDTEELSEDSFQDLDEFMNNADNLAESCMNDLRENLKSATENVQVHSTQFEKKSQSTVKPNQEKVSVDRQDSADLDEDDFAVKLIEETTPKVIPTKKKKGLLELPLPWSKELVDNVTSTESSEKPMKPLLSNERDPRRKNFKNDSSNNLFDQKLPPSTVSNVVHSDIRSVSSNIPKMQFTAGISMDTVHGPNHHCSSGFQNISTDGYTGKMQQNIQTPETFYGSDKSDLCSFQSSHLPKDSSQFFQYNNRYPSEFRDPKFRNTSPHISPFLKPVPITKLPVCHSYPFYEPKSYVEYKRMKQEQEKLNQCELQQKEKSSIENTTITEGNRLSSDKDDEKNNCTKISESQNAKSKDSHSNQISSKQNRKTPSNHSNEDKRKTTERRKCVSNAENRSSDSWNKKSHREDMKKEEDDKRKKINVDKKHSSDSEELVSPLEKLYENKDKPKTGRGYGLQNFKIPKKTREPVFSETTKTNDNREIPKDVVSNVVTKEDSHSKVTSTGTEVSVSKDKNKSENKNEKEMKENHETVITKNLDNSEVISEKLSTSEKDENVSSKEKIVSSEQTDCENVADKLDNIQGMTKSKEELKVGSEIGNVKEHVTSKVNLDVVEKEKVEIRNQKESKSETPKKCEAQIVECDSSVENTEVSPKKGDSDKSVSSKEEITQEFVEALIRKSFRSGEGKLLLAQAKLFEELARKLNSKKLKTIQKIINSESDSSSSSSNMSSEEEKRTLKSKDKAKNKKRKKKLKKNRKHKLTSSSESEDSEKETVDKKQVSVAAKNEKSDNSDRVTLHNESVKDTSDSSAPQVKGNRNKKSQRRAIDFGKAISTKKTRRKQGQKKLLEQILDEEPQQDDTEIVPSEEVSGKDSEQKTKPKPKTKVKTELDRLHEDIRNMFICSGVVTATGQRMCRILKESGGNMNNLDIVKESAKMVEEEKLKRVQGRYSSRSSRSATSKTLGIRTRSQPLEKVTGRDRSKSKMKNENQTENLPSEKLDTETNIGSSLSCDISQWQPVVVLQRVDLNKFNYGLKISDTCVSFPRLCGGNTAIRGKNQAKNVCEKSSQDLSTDNLTFGIYLARNKRKYERLKNKKLKRGYIGKKLTDILKNLPLKMNKMRHLQLHEQVKIENTVGLKKINIGLNKTLEKREGRKKNLKPYSNLLCDGILGYAFFKKRLIYPCKLCSHITSSITAHYKTSHPESEVLISRLNRTEAKRAISDSIRNNYNITKSNQPSSLVTPKEDSEVSYCCRMCNCGKFSDGETFFSHVSFHTGEYRYQCPAKGCNVTMPLNETIELHILTKHTEERYVLYQKIIKLFPIPLENGILFGFLCSECNFVQTFLTNLENHIQRQHSSLYRVKIIKINMSAVETESKRKGDKLKQNTTLGENSEDNSVEIDVIEKEEESESVTSASAVFSVTGEESNSEIVESRKRKLKTEDLNPENSLGFENKNEDGSCEYPENKKFLIDCEEGSLLNVQCCEKVEDESSTNLTNENESTESVPILIKETDVDKETLESRGSLDSDKVNKMSSNDLLENASENQQGYKNLRVGSLEAQILDNSEILYECFIKGCLFSTKSYDSFDKHISISHSTTEWDGLCDLCCKESKMESLPKKSLQLSSALKHLKQHTTDRITETISGIIKEEMRDPKPQCKIAGDENSLLYKNLENEVRTEEANEGNLVLPKPEDSNSPLPVKPLLRVRNLLGDRLSTPKDSAEESDVVVTVNEQPVCCTYDPKENSKRDEPVMFTIENVRSLKTDAEMPNEIETESEKGEIKIESVCSIVQAKTDMNQTPNTVSGKTVLVRSCPTRKIAIQPETSTSFPVEIGQIKVPSTAAQSLLLNPLPNSTPIRLIPSLTCLPHATKFTIKPLTVSGTCKTGSLMVHSVTSPGVHTPSGIEVSTSNSSATEVPIGVLTEVSSKAPTEAAKFSSKNMVSGGRTKVYTPIKTSLVPLAPKESENKEEKNKETESQIPYGRPGPGQKTCKDDRVFKEMLTKTKLCHLFKCMAVECSFTCNSESVFTQHIGLHEVHRRIKKQNRDMKSVYLDSCNNSKKVFNWQQCAYCCEVLGNSSGTLSQHIIMEHGHCIYQCAYCFYRAVCQSYVEIHQNLAHSQKLKNNSRVIYRCKPHKILPKNPFEKCNRKQSVRPYHCDQCGKRFYITQDFMNHLTTEHQSVTAYTCHICRNLCLKADRLINHYKLHSYCTYQCAYCLHGTETEKEMLFHLCNFHFSQSPFMYVRTLSEGKSSHPKGLDSLKVISYENEVSNPDCLEDADSELEIDESSAASASIDLTSIAAELGINTENDSFSSVTPLMKELAVIENKNSKTILLKSLLPNAEFSSENDSGTENCSVLISSGLTSPLGEEKDVNVPLGQLPLQSVKVQKKESLLQKKMGSLDESLKLNEVVGFPSKDKNEGATEKSSTSKKTAAKHNLLRVVPSKKSVPINIFPLVNVNLKKKHEESTQPQGNSGESSNMPNMLFKILSQSGKQESCIVDENNKNIQEKKEKTLPNIVENKKNSEGLLVANTEAETVAPIQPVITNVVSLWGKEFEEKKNASVVNPEIDNSSIIISDYCSLSYSTIQNLESPTSAPKMLINILSKVEAPAALKPPIIRVEDFPIVDTLDQNLNTNSTDTKNSSVECGNSNKKTAERIPDSSADEANIQSPDVIILEEDKPNKNIETVTLDSGDEKDNESSETIEKNGVSKEVASKSSDSNIRKEMELLRNQIANETDCLLFDDSEHKRKIQTTEATKVTKEPKKPEGSLKLKLNDGTAEPQTETIMSPIEEAICTLNKELKFETSKDQEKAEEKKNKSPKKQIITTPERPRTRFGVRKEQVGDPVEKSDGEDISGGTTVECEKEEPNKNKKPITGLNGTDLYICGNEKCNFATTGENLLKEHLFVCDLSRDTSVLVCPHCSKKIKVFNSYIEHVKHHGPKNFHCGLCEFSTAVENSIVRHMKQKHRIYQFKNVPKDPPNENHLVFYPKNYRLEKNDFEVNGYSPGDEDKLPLQSVYQVNVKCAKCPYFTKVRSNMVRHLKIHVKSAETEGVVVVPSTAPTNPVPCLDTKEKMFDKMTNLAASSQLAQTKDKTLMESLPPEEETKLPQFVSEQMRYKCCLPDCNYITIDDSMLKHHIKALHDEINYYSCPHCKNTVHVDVRNVTLDKIGHHLKHHDNKLYKCAHCIYFHYQKGIVEKHTVEKHPDRRFFVYTVREPKPEIASEEEQSSNDSVTKAWKCGLCSEFQSQSKMSVVEHLAKIHNTKSRYKCQLCLMKSNHYQSFFGHFATKHAGEKVAYDRLIIPINVSGVESQSGSSGADSSGEHFDTTPLWQRGAPRVRHIRGILIEEEEVKTKKSKRMSGEGESVPGVSEPITSGKAFYCPLCSDKKKVFHTRNADCFRSHLYQELNYQQFACILCGKMFVDKKDFDKHHAKVHPNKPASMKQTKEDGEIMFWVDKVIAKQLEEMQGKKRCLSEEESNEGQRLPKKKKEV